MKNLLDIEWKYRGQGSSLVHLTTESIAVCPRNTHDILDSYHYIIPVGTLIKKSTYQGRSYASWMGPHGVYTSVYLHELENEIAPPAYLAPTLPVIDLLDIKWSYIDGELTHISHRPIVYQVNQALYTIPANTLVTLDTDNHGTLYAQFHRSFEANPTSVAMDTLGKL